MKKALALLQALDCYGVPTGIKIKDNMLNLINFIDIIILTSIKVPQK